jgi:hypothetical protein
MSIADTPPPAGRPVPDTESALRNLTGVADILSALAASAAHSHTRWEALEFLADSVTTIQEALQAEFDARHLRATSRTNGGEQ